MTSELERLAKALGEAADYGNLDMIWEATEHSGDCTNQAWSCALCQKEELLDWTKAVLNVIADSPPEVVAEMAKAFAPHLWPSEDASAWDKAQALTVEAAREKALVEKRVRAALAALVKTLGEEG